MRLYLDKTPKDKWDDEKLLDLCSELINHLSDSTSSAFSQFQKDLSDIFKAQGRTTFADPRICLKSIENNGSEVYIFEMERGREGSGKKWDKFPANLNTGFDKVLKTGDYYSCADIPTEANFGRYKNKRLSLIAVKNYMQGLSVHNNNNNNNEWEKCWDRDDDDSSPAPSSCYKSTLIIPLTLSHSGIGDRALKILGMNNLRHTQTTVGFLCFDHQDTNYFTDSDRRIAYTYADNLSMYLFTRINYINSSGTLSKVTNFLSKEKIDELYRRLKIEGDYDALDFIKRKS